MRSGYRENFQSCPKHASRGGGWVTHAPNALRERRAIHGIRATKMRILGKVEFGSFWGMCEDSRRVVHIDEYPPGLAAVREDTQLDRPGSFTRNP